jgi:6-phosphogluconolactonase
MNLAWNPARRSRFQRAAAFAMMSLLVAALGQAAPVSGRGKVALYASVGPELAQYDVDAASATLTRRGSVTLPDNVQYAWPHPSSRFLYVAWSNGAGADHHGVTAFRVDPESGALHPLGDPVALRARPVHITVDIAGTHLLVAYNDPSGLSVHTLAADGTIGSQVKQAASLDLGIYGHQVRADPSGNSVILVTRGNGPARGKPEDPGALKIFGYRDGKLTNLASIAPNRGYGFQPRHLDFHPSGPWVFVSLERQNKLQVYKKAADGTLSREPLFTKDSLTKPGASGHGQAAGTVHVHPNGKFVYQANRAGGTVQFEGKAVFAGGENAIAVYAIDPNTGEPSLIQNADTRGLEPRTFALDASGQILVAANQDAGFVRDGSQARAVSAGLAVFRVRGDGKLDFVRKYDVETGGSRNLFWMGLVSLP